MIKIGLSYIAIFLFALLSIVSKAQQTIIRGKVTDAVNGNPIPFANVVLKNTTIGETTDFDGNYVIKTLNPTDTIVASCVGYVPRSKSIKRGVEQTINFQMTEDTGTLEAVTVLSGENPAWGVMGNVVKNKNKNDKRKLDAYEYDTYTKIEVDINNVSEKLRGRKVMKKISAVLDSIEHLAGEDGRPIIPLFLTESVSKIFYKSEPELKKELIKKTKISGVGVEDGTLVTQLIGSSFQEYNFYKNWLTILNKSFVSPISDGWKIYYDYYLVDSLNIGSDFCYKMDFSPKNPIDLAFSGTMWITKNGFAIKRIDVTVGESANINFIEKIKIQQEMIQVDGGFWLPLKNRILIDLQELSKNSSGMLAKFYTSNKNFEINKVRENKFYLNAIETEETARMFNDEKYWDTLRHEKLSPSEINVYKMIDTLKNIPIVKTYTDIIKLFVGGFYTLGKVDIGPYTGILTYNDKEGIHLESGFKTNDNFSRRWTFGGQFGYGFYDKKIKYSWFVQNIMSRKHWTTASFLFRRDLTRIGADVDQIGNSSLFSIASRWGVYRTAYYHDDIQLSFFRELFRGFSMQERLRYWTFNPAFNFGYYLDPSSKVIEDSFSTTELITEIEYAHNETFIQNGNQRIRLHSSRWPVVSFQYTHGIKGIFGSSFNYDKVRLTFNKQIRMGIFGTGNLLLSGEYIFNTLPYPLLTLHLGNQTPVNVPANYNLMNFGEFASDHYASIHYTQNFEGLFLNRIPLLKKLKWRVLATGKMLVGGMRMENQNLVSEFTINGEPTIRTTYFSNKPYIEVGYGIENIFKFLRIDFVHRLSYVNNPNVRTFGIVFMAQFKL